MSSHVRLQVKCICNVKHRRRSSGLGKKKKKLLNSCKAELQQSIFGAIQYIWHLKKRKSHTLHAHIVCTIWHVLQVDNKYIRTWMHHMQYSYFILLRWISALRALFVIKQCTADRCFKVRLKPYYHKAHASDTIRNPTHTNSRLHKVLCHRVSEITVHTSTFSLTTPSYVYDQRHT